jgi:hypothetical protein
MIRSARGPVRGRCRTQRLVSRTFIATSLMAACNVLWSCSPYIYSPDVQTLSTQVSSIRTSDQQNESAITNQQYQNSRFLWIRDKTTLARGPGCGLDYTGPVPCGLVAAPPASPPTKASNDPSSGRPKDVCETSDASGPVNSAAPPTKANQLTTADLLKALDNYTAALAAVTKAQDRADFNTAAGKVSAAVGGLAQAAGPYGAAAAPIAKASVNIALWFVGEALDYQRLEELRIATSAACEPIHVVTDALGLLLENQRGTRLGGLDEWLNDMLQAANKAQRARGVSDQIVGTAIDNAQAAAAAFEAVRVSNPRATLQALSDAHDALVVAVRDNNGEFSALVTNLQTLVMQTQALAAAAAPPAKKS